MPTAPTLDKVESRSDYSFHRESVLLVSETNRCFGYELTDLLEDVLGDASGYEEFFAYTPHSHGFDLLDEANAEDKIVSLENSMWLVEANCFSRDSLRLRSFIQNKVPPEAEIVVWKNHEIDLGVDLEDIASISHKIFVTKSEQSLKTSIRSYFTRDCHPRRSKHCVDWKISARTQQETII
ncbi:hypothetical protein [Haladaptatus sp. DYSN1]|uniref:hypothetical protein n=1 Tax=unclassified Haladaptatus TaxID=2622732 RepID=UPI00240748C0|nr:hypothetical protein [Haladaptatus sp. DYSN1]